MKLIGSMSTATRRLRLERTNGMWVINGETWEDNWEMRFRRRPEAAPA